ncbi:MAG: hypothetical protein ACRD41_17785, partial [Candidatus Acidiferrales bacterium]
MNKCCLLIFPLCFTLIVFSTGCASNRAQIDAWQDSDFSPTRTDKMALAVVQNPSDETVELGRILAAELTRENFNLVPFDQADYSLACLMEDDSEERYTPGQQPFMQIPSPPMGLDDDPSTFRTRATVFPPTYIVFHKKAI